MSTTEDSQEPGGALEPEGPERMPAKPVFARDVLDPNTWESFFRLTGGSVFYCLSAVLTAYGIVKMLGPALSEGKGFWAALPCILTLHVYELALLGVLVLIVRRQIVDDAVSIAVLIALFLIGTSMALGSVADRDTLNSFYLGLLGAALALEKLYAMKRFTRIPFGILSMPGLWALVACNYLGPVMMARTISINPAHEASRRSVWLLIWLIMLIGAGLVIIEAARAKPRLPAGKNKRVPFLQTPAMVYVFAIIIMIASGIHQYTMAFTFALERALGDFGPVITICALLAIEALRHSGKRFGWTEVAVSCVPLAVIILAVQHKAVLASGELGIGLLCYPPIALALSGLTIAALAAYHRWRRLLYVVFAYGLGIILTAGFSPESPHDLNVNACLATLVIALLIYGAVSRNQNICLVGIFALLPGLCRIENFTTFVADSCGLTLGGALVGVLGLGCVALWLMFGDELRKDVRILGVLCLAGFVFDYLPEYIHWKYLFVLLGAGSLSVALWFRTRDIVLMPILLAPILARLYMAAKHVAHWRLVILGFLLLGAGTAASLFKQRTKNKLDSDSRFDNDSG